jgi:CheY-like chemotaxis protein
VSGAAILVAEDQETVRALLEDLLADLGYEPVAGGTAADALARFRARPGIRLALIDVSLPDRSGFDLLADLRALAPGLPAILSSGFDIGVTGAVPGAALAAARAAGPIEVLAKPYRIDGLAAAIDRLLAAR